MLPFATIDTKLIVSYNCDGSDMTEMIFFLTAKNKR